MLPNIWVDQLCLMRGSPDIADHSTNVFYNHRFYRGQQLLGGGLASGSVAGGVLARFDGPGTVSSFPGRQTTVDDFHHGSFAMT